MAQEDKRSDAPEIEQPDDEVVQLKKRARRRLIGSVALALLAAIVLPMVMDNQPAPPLKDIQVRIPSPDEGAAQRGVPKPAAAASSVVKEEKLAAAAPVEPPLPVKPAVKDDAAPPAVKPLEKPESKPADKPEPKHESKQQPKQESRAESKSAADEGARAQNALTGKAATESWEVQLGAYQEPARVKILVTKLKELGIPTYTEKVDTPSGPRTRVRAGPFHSQEAAEKARTRAKIVGVDGPVARKP